MDQQCGETVEEVHMVCIKCARECGLQTRISWKISTIILQRNDA